MPSGKASNQRPVPLAQVSLLGIGSEVPERRLTNAELTKLVDTSDEWIRTRTGIGERRILAEGQTTSDLAAAAARRALLSAELEADEVEVLIVATATPDQPVPCTAAFVQEKIGARNAMGFDVDAGCTGFLYALQVARALIASGAYANALVIGADALSLLTDYQSRETCVLFGDAAGAVVLGREGGKAHLTDMQLGLDGRGTAMIEVPAGGTARPTSPATVEAREHYLRMNGREVFRFAVDKLSTLTRELCEPQRPGARGHRPDRAAPGQRPHPGRGRRGARGRARTHVLEPREVRQHQRGLDPARDRRGAARGPHRAGPQGDPGRLRRGAGVGRSVDRVRARLAMRCALWCLPPLLVAGLACGRDTGPPRSSLLAIECRSKELSAQTLELAVFEGQVSVFQRRRLHVVDGQLWWGAESFGSVKRGDKVEFTDDGWSVNGERRTPIGIVLELHQNGSTIKLDVNEQVSTTGEHDNRVGDVHWYFFDGILHIGDHAYGPIRPGDTVRVDGDEVLVNGKPASARH